MLGPLEAQATGEIARVPGITAKAARMLLAKLAELLTLAGRILAVLKELVVIIQRVVNAGKG